MFYLLRVKGHKGSQHHSKMTNNNYAKYCKLSVNVCFIMKTVLTADPFLKPNQRTAA